jgi:UDPglucose 6-dehydrogenase
VAHEAAHAYLDDVFYCDDAYEAARDADALVLVTAWNEFKQLDMQKLRHLMRGSVLVDGRNIYDPHEMRLAGFNYAGVGR